MLMDFDTLKGADVITPGRVSQVLQPRYSCLSQAVNTQHPAACQREEPQRAPCPWSESSAALCRLIAQYKCACVCVHVLGRGVQSPE